MSQSYLWAQVANEAPSVRALPSPSFAFAALIARVR